MKSFQEFVGQSHLQEAEVVQPSFKGIGKKHIKKGSSEIEKARKALEKTPTLSDAEMRSQNPGPTAAYEKDAAERKARRTVTVKTPEGQITAGGTTKSGKIPFQTSSGKTIHVTPDEAIARAESQSKTKIVKKKIKKTPTAVKPSAPEVKAPEVKAPEVKTAVTKPASAKIELPKSTRTAAQKAQPGLYKVPTSRQLPSPKTPEAPKITAPKTVSKPAFSKPPVVKAPKPSVGSIVKDALKSERKARAAEKAAQSASRAAAATKFLGNVGKTAGIIGAGIEARQGYDAARREGASRKRSIGAGAARALGGLAGGALGGAAGSVLGIPGQVGGAVAGYQAGTELGTKAYRALTGDPGKKLTTQGLLSNIRKTVPYSVRSSVPEPARKTFKSFVTQAGKTYGQLQKNIKK